MSKFRTFSICLKKNWCVHGGLGAGPGRKWHWSQLSKGNFKKLAHSGEQCKKLPLRRGSGRVLSLVRRALARCTGSCTNKLLKWGINNKINGERRSSDIWIIRFLLYAILAERGGPGRGLCNENVLPIKLKGEQPCCPCSCMWHWLLESRGY